MTLMHRARYGAAFALMLAAPAAAQSPAPADDSNAARTLQAARITGSAPVIDGRLDEAVWATAGVASDFVQRRPTPGEPAKQRTEARVVYDADAVYVGMKMFDTPESIASQLARRDATGVFSDWVDVIIDSYFDRRTAYRFSVNPRGVQKDVYHFDDGNEDVSWDAVWEVQTSVDADGWTAEFRIPLSQLRFTPSSNDSDEQVWGVQFGRTVARTEEQTFWAPVVPTTPGFISQAGELRGVRGLGSPKRLEVLPYTVAKATRAPEPQAGVRNPFFEATSSTASFGADLKYGITSNLTLTGTINPDFGQVEADPAVVNLSAFESFFPEQRPFFLEGSNIFAFSVGDGPMESLFYSRRIGRTPQRGFYPGADYTDTDEATTILGAAKVTGRTSNGWSIGVFDAVTQAENSRAAIGGEISEFAAEPLTNYAVARVNRDVRRGLSTYGAMMTATHRSLDDDAFAFLRTSAYSWGLNGRHRFGPGNNLAVQAYLSGSSIFGDTVAIQQAQLSSARYYQRPDADHLEYDRAATSMHGLAGEAFVQKMGGRLSGSVGGRFRTPGYEINDIGFLQNSDFWFVFGSFNYNQFTPGKIFRNWNVGMNPSSGYDFGGTNQWTQVNLYGNGQFNNFWFANFFTSYRADSWSTAALRGGPAIVSPGGQNWNFNVTSDRRKPVSFNFGAGGYIERGTDTRRINYFGSLMARPSSQIDVSLSPSFSVGEPAWQYVSTTRVRNADGTQRADEVEYLFAGLDQKTASLTARVSYTVSPKLSFQVYAQPFVSAGDYTTFRRVEDPRASAFSERFTDFAESDLTYDAQARQYRASLGDGTHVRFQNPDFNVRSLRSNAVVRWEYRPGSTLFLVWSSGRNGFRGAGDFDFSRDFDALLGDASTNVLLVKMNYWLNF